MKKSKTPDEKWLVGSIAAIVGMFLGTVVSLDVGEIVAKKYSMSEKAVILETVKLTPFNSSGVYIATGKTQHGKKVVQYLLDGELFKEPYDWNVIIFCNDSTPAKQSVRVNAGHFWRWFAIIPVMPRFILPDSGLQEGSVVKTYKFIPKS